MWLFEGPVCRLRSRVGMLVTAAGRPYGEKIWLTSTDSTLILHAEASGVLQDLYLEIL